MTTVDHTIVVFLGVHGVVMVSFVGLLLLLAKNIRYRPRLGKAIPLTETRRLQMISTTPSLGDRAAGGCDG